MGETHLIFSIVQTKISYIHLDIISYSKSQMGIIFCFKFSFRNKIFIKL